MSPDEVRVLRVPLAGDERDLPPLAASLSDDERARAARFLRPELGARFVRAHAALRSALAAAVGCAPAELAFATGEHGKPYLTAPETDVRFNLAHSGELALVALTVGREVGVDVEAVRPVRADEIAERFFAPGEARALRDLDGDERELAFLRCWTRKEAWVKARGGGLSIPLGSFEVGVGALEARDPTVLELAGESWVLRDLTPRAGYVGCVAAPGSEWDATMVDPGA